MTKVKNINDLKSDVPVDGSLGLLAIGYRGVMAWRNARQEAGIDIVEDRRKEYEERKVEFEKKKAEFEKKKAELKAEKEANLPTGQAGEKKNSKGKKK